MKSFLLSFMMLFMALAATAQHGGHGIGHNGGGHGISHGGGGHYNYGGHHATSHINYGHHYDPYVYYNPPPPYYADRHYGRRHHYPRHARKWSRADYYYRNGYRY